MAFLILGIVLLVLKFFEFGWVAGWPWWVVLAPFGLAVLWWAIADSIGLTQRRAMQKMEKRKTDRRERQLEDLGLKPRPRRGVRGLRDSTFQADDAPKGDQRGKPPR